VTIQILDRAEDDLVQGFWFYESQRVGLGSYFRASLYSDIESLRLYAGIHRRVYGSYHRLLSKRFPFAVFYTASENTVFVHAVLDCRRDPAWIRERVRGQVRPAASDLESVPPGPVVSWSCRLSWVLCPPSPVPGGPWSLVFWSRCR